MNNQNHKKMEITGITIVLLSTFIQLFILPKTQSITDNATRHKIENKLDIIYRITQNMKYICKQKVMAVTDQSWINYITTVSEDHEFCAGSAY